MGDQRIIRCVIDGQVYQIPEYWLVGRCQAREQDGEDPQAAYLGALADWAQQVVLARAAGYAN